MNQPDTLWTLATAAMSVGSTIAIAGMAFLVYSLLERYDARRRGK